MKLTRRQLLSHGLGFALVSSSSAIGYHYLKPKSASVSVRYPGMEIGHFIRDFQQKKLPVNPNIIEVDTIIIGSGAAALSALWWLKKQGHEKWLLLEGPEQNGNNAFGQYQDLQYPTGAHYLPTPTIESDYINDLLSDIGLYQNQQYDEASLVHAPAERLFTNTKWQNELLPELDTDSQRFFNQIEILQNTIGADGLKTFTIPIAKSSQDPKWLALDNITFSAWLQKNQYASDSLLWYLNYCCLDDYGQGIDQVSAWAGLQYFAARNHEKNHHTPQLLTWNNGLGNLSTRMRDWLKISPITDIKMLNRLPETYRYSLFSSALFIKEHQDFVEIHIYHQNQIHIIHATNAISAMPIYIANKIVHNIEQYGFQAAKHMPTYAPWLIGNFVLNSFPKEKSQLAWDNVVYPSPALGYINSTHQGIYVAKPEKTVLTSYRALDFLPADKMRNWLQKAEQAELIQLASEDLNTVYGKEFWGRVEHIELTIRGHAMASPTIGSIHNNGLKALRNHQSKLLFAHSDLSGYSIFEEAAWHGIQAAKKVLHTL